MIIANYPGAGGHRYSLFLRGLSFDAPDQHMHTQGLTYHSYLYLTDETVQDRFFDKTLVKNTHTLNTDLIKKFFPGHEIVKIRSDLKKSLCRAWRVVTQYQYDARSAQDKIGQMFSMIAWHHNYYSLYPVDWTTDTVIDIDTDATEFGTIMRSELDKTDPMFDLAWEVYEKHGPDAPIIDLYNQHAQQQR